MVVMVMVTMVVMVVIVMMLLVMVVMILMLEEDFVDVCGVVESKDLANLFEMLGKDQTTRQQSCKENPA